MTRDDLPLGQRLSRQAGWNQTEADWLRHLDLQPDGAFVAECEVGPVATVTTARYGPVAWVAMMLVDQAWRGRGIGRALLSHALEVLDDRGVATVRLDATPLGQPLYESLGFAAESSWMRYGGRPSAQVEPTATTQPLAADRMDDLAAFDRTITGIDRSRLLARLATENPGTARIFDPGGGLEGYAMTRPGSEASQVGPGLATPLAGPTLLSGALDCQAGRPVFVDIPSDHAESRALVEGRGLVVQRHLLRMCRGRAITERVEAIWAGAGPDFG
jgi:GNAT superfamily N-acetyltransferase